MRKYDTGTATLATQDYIELVKCKEVLKAIFEDCKVLEVNGNKYGHIFNVDNNLLKLYFPAEYKEATNKADLIWKGEKTNV